MIKNTITKMKNILGRRLTRRLSAAVEKIRKLEDIAIEAN